MIFPLKKYLSKSLFLRFAPLRSAVDFMLFIVRFLTRIVRLAHQCFVGMRFAYHFGLGFQDSRLCKHRPKPILAKTIHNKNKQKNKYTLYGIRPGADPHQFPPFYENQSEFS